MHPGCGDFAWVRSWNSLALSPCRQTGRFIANGKVVLKMEKSKPSLILPAYGDDLKRGGLPGEVEALIAMLEKEFGKTKAPMGIFWF